MDDSTRTLTLTIPEISCAHCQAAIEGAVRPLPGVVAADVDVASRTLRMSLAGDADLGAVTAAIEDAGYDVPAQPGLGTGH
jgi:copper chaperone CopZ